MNKILFSKQKIQKTPQIKALMMFFVVIMSLLSACGGGSAYAPRTAGQAPQKTINDFIGEPLSLRYLLNKPPFYSDAVKSPALFLLHGYRSNEKDLFWLKDKFDSKIVTFSVQAPIPAPRPDAYEWYSLHRKESGELEINADEAKENLKKLKKFVDEAVKTYNLDEKRLFFVGFSQGAIMSNAMAIQYPETVTGIGSLSGRFPAFIDKKTIKKENITNENIFISHGKKDNVIPFTSAEDLNDFWTKAECNLTFKQYDAAHTFTQQNYNDLERWMRKELAKKGN